MDYKTLLKEFWTNSNAFTFDIFEEEDFLKIQIAENKLVFYFPNVIDEKMKNTERSEIEELEKEIKEMENIFSDTDTELYLKKKQLEQLEKNFSNRYNRKRILDKKNSFLFELKIEKAKDKKENDEKIEEFKTVFYCFLAKLIKLKRLEDKVINSASIVYALGLPCEVNWIQYISEDKRTYQIRRYFEKLF